MRLRNRMVKATYWTDPELCRWKRDKRDFYRALWACAEDSCCIEDDMFGVKLAAFPSPLDADMSVERFETWRDEILEQGKVVAYEVGGRRYLYLPAMSRNENPSNPQSPSTPLPAWIRWQPHATDPRKGRYVDTLGEMAPTLGAKAPGPESAQVSGGRVAQALGNDSPTPPVLDRTELNGTEPDCAVLVVAPAAKDAHARADVVEVSKAYERFTGTTAPNLTALCADHPTSRIVEAIRKAADSGHAPTPAFIRSITQRLAAERWKAPPTITSESNPYSQIC